MSITQSFNTTTSMGRLTLNMLLSFAQFEREVKRERIRDKIYASKRKGIWIGGPRDEKLVALIAESRAIMAQITTDPNKSIPELAAEQGRCRVRTMKVAKRACLDPDIVTAIVEGR